jgi:hypothetical protein
MSDKQVFLALIGGLASAVLGALAFAAVLFLLEALGHVHVDGGDDGWALLGFALWS